MLKFTLEAHTAEYRKARKKERERMIIEDRYSDDDPHTGMPLGPPSMPSSCFWLLLLLLPTLLQLERQGPWQ